MEILTSTKNVSKVIFKLTLDWATNDERDNETLLFNNKEDAVEEFEAQLKKIKTDKSSWEYEALSQHVFQYGKRQLRLLELGGQHLADVQEGNPRAQRMPLSTRRLWRPRRSRHEDRIPSLGAVRRNSQLKGLQGSEPPY